jgi:hypothetical protein
MTTNFKKIPIEKIIYLFSNKLPNNLIFKKMSRKLNEGELHGIGQRWVRHGRGVRRGRGGRGGPEIREQIEAVRNG